MKPAKEKPITLGAPTKRAVQEATERLREASERAERLLALREPRPEPALGTETYSQMAARWKAEPREEPVVETSPGPFNETRERPGRRNIKVSLDIIAECLVTGAAFDPSLQLPEDAMLVRTSLDWERDLLVFTFQSVQFRPPFFPGNEIPTLSVIPQARLIARESPPLPPLDPQEEAAALEYSRQMDEADEANERLRRASLGMAPVPETVPDELRARLERNVARPPERKRVIDVLGPLEPDPARAFAWAQEAIDRDVPIADVVAARMAALDEQQQVAFDKARAERRRAMGLDPSEGISEERANEILASMDRQDRAGQAGWDKALATRTKAARAQLDPSGNGPDINPPAPERVVDGRAYMRTQRIDPDPPLVDEGQGFLPARAEGYAVIVAEGMMDIASPEPDRTLATYLRTGAKLEPDVLEMLESDDEDPETRALIAAAALTPEGERILAERLERRALRKKLEFEALSPPKGRLAKMRVERSTKKPQEPRLTTAAIDTKGKDMILGLPVVIESGGPADLGSVTVWPARVTPSEQEQRDSLEREEREMGGPDLAPDDYAQPDDGPDPDEDSRSGYDSETADPPTTQQRPDDFATDDDIPF